MSKVGRATLGATGTAVVATVVGLYLPGVLRQATAPLLADSPVAFHVIHNEEPPIAMQMPTPAIAMSSPGLSCHGFEQRVSLLGGADAGSTSFELVAQGNTESPVFIAGMRARIVSQTTPKSGVYVVCPSAGTTTPRAIQINLDRSGTGQYITKAGVSPFGFTLSKGETEEFQITASSKKADYKWELEVLLVVDGQEGIVRITNSGRPFATTVYDPEGFHYEWDGAYGWAPVQDFRIVGKGIATGYRLG